MTYVTCSGCRDKHYCFNPVPQDSPHTRRLEPFIQAWCLTGEDRSIQASKLYRVYRAWEASEGGTPMGIKLFGQSIRALGHPALKASVFYYHGISLTPEAYEYASTQLW